MSRDWPKARKSMQKLVDSALGALALDSTRQYGLVTGGPTINTDRCQECLDEGKRRGIVPTPDAVERFLADLQLADAYNRASPGERKEAELGWRQAEMKRRAQKDPLK